MSNQQNQPKIIHYHINAKIVNIADQGIGSNQGEAKQIFEIDTNSQIIDLKNQVASLKSKISELENGYKKDLKLTDFADKKATTIIKREFKKKAANVYMNLSIKELMEIHPHFSEFTIYDEDSLNKKNFQRLSFGNVIEVIQKNKRI